MTRWIIVLSLVALGMTQALAVAACPSGKPNEIFCEDFDTYCTGGGYPGSPDCAPGSTKDDTRLQAVWKTTSWDDSTNSACGTQFTVDTNATYLSSTPFGGRHPCARIEPIGQQTVSNWNDNPPTPGIGFLINQVFPGYQAVTATEGNPLVLEFYLSGINKPEYAIGGGLSRSSAYMELAMGDDRVNTDFVWSPNCASYCSPTISQGPFPIMCAQGNPYSPVPTGCPSATTAPIHNAMAIGTMTMLDVDPCHCGVQEHGPIMWHLTVFDGQLWWILRSNSPKDSSKSPAPTPEDPNAPPPPLAELNVPGDFVLMAGKPGGDGPPNQWVKLTIKSTTFDVEMTAREKASNGYVYRVTSVMNGIDRKYLGCFDQLRGGVGAGCPLASSASWTNNCAEGGRKCLISLQNNANAVVFDDLVLHGGIGCSLNGACCLDDASCVDNMSREACEAEPTAQPPGLGGVWRGASTVCDTLPTACCPVPFADADHDKDVDQIDFGLFQACFTGNGGGLLANCECFDRAKDGDVDGLDFEEFTKCWSGPGIRWIDTPACNP